MPKFQLFPARQEDIDRLRSPTPLFCSEAQKVPARFFPWVCFLLSTHSGAREAGAWLTICIPPSSTHHGGSGAPSGGGRTGPNSRALALPKTASFPPEFLFRPREMNRNNPLPHHHLTKDPAGGWENKIPCTLKKAAQSTFISCLPSFLCFLSPKGKEE